MKHLKKLHVNQLATLQKLSIEEMMMLFGGLGCCWEVMAEAYRRMYASEYASDTHNQSPYFTASYYQEQWGNYMGDETDESGDPLTGDPSKGQIDQTQDLYDFMANNFFNTTTVSKFESNDFFNMLRTSAVNNNGEQLAFGIIDAGNGKDKHAVLMTGITYDEVTGEKLINYWDPETEKEYTSSKGNFICGTGLYRKE